MAYDLDLDIARVLPLLDIPRSVAEIGIPMGVIRRLQRNGYVRPKMRPLFNRDGRRVGAQECWQRAEPPAPKPPRLDCAVIDFAEYGIF